MTKTIHCCWVGGRIPPVFEKNIDHWKKLNPDFDIRLWMDNNLDFSEWDGLNPALFTPAMVSDLVRLSKVHSEGGWWLDLDIELFRPLDSLAGFREKFLISYMYPCALGTAAFYAPPGHPLIKAILDRYRSIPAGKPPVSNSVFTEYFVNEVPGFLLDGREWDGDDCHVFPKETFEQPSLPWTGGVSMHHCAGAWMGKSARTDFLYNRPWPMSARLVKWGKRKIRTWSALRKNEFYPVYKAARQGKALRFDPVHYYATRDISP